jgi:Protein of unknown function (DUF3300)
MTRFSRLITIAVLWSVPLGAMAQQPATAPTQPLLKPAELDQLLAPMALHPDPLLSEVLIASTYPLEVVQADRWAKSNKALKGDALTAAHRPPAKPLRVAGVHRSQRILRSSAGYGYMGRITGIAIRPIPATGASGFRAYIWSRIT